MNAPQSSTFKMFDGVSTVDLQSENQMSKLLINIIIGNYSTG